jgi:hypothetical protein
MGFDCLAVVGPCKVDQHRSDRIGWGTDHTRGTSGIFRRRASRVLYRFVN